MGHWDYGWGYSSYPRTLSVGERIRKAEAVRKRLEKKGETLSPVVISGRGLEICTSWWGKAWCRNLERYHDFENRLPRGRSYVRHGSVIDLGVQPGLVTAQVCGTRLYQVRVHIKPLGSERWRSLVEECAGEIGSVIELLQGTFSDSIMKKMTEPRKGLFPEPGEISFECSCPDFASMCKHVAATLYGLGARLDSDPGLFFLLRDVDPNVLITQATTEGILAGSFKPGNQEDKLEDAEDLGSLFGIEIAKEPPPPEPKVQPRKTGKGRRDSGNQAQSGQTKPGSGRTAAVGKSTAAVGKATVAVRKATAAVKESTEAVRKSAGLGNKAIPPVPKAAPEEDSPRRITSARLREMGFPPAQIRFAVSLGFLRATNSRGIFETTATTRTWLKRMGMNLPRDI